MSLSGTPARVLISFEGVPSAIMSTTFVPTLHQKVYFGRSRGEQTLGEIVKINRVKVKVKQLESRGTLKSHPVGTIWTVPLSLCTPAGDAKPVVTEPARPAPVSTLAKRPEDVIMNEILAVYGDLSPENLTCDGELPMSAVRARATSLRLKLRTLFAEIGRNVSEDEAYRWWDSHRQAAQ
jgi:hypothetical protein